MNSEDRDEIRITSLKDQELVMKIKNSFNTVKNNFYKQPFFKTKENSVNFILDKYNITSLKSSFNNTV